MFVVLYFLMIRPQMKRAKEHKTMLDALKKGDEVITAGGIVGKITKVGDELRDARRSPPVDGSRSKCRCSSSAVQTLLPKGTIKAI